MQGRSVPVHLQAEQFSELEKLARSLNVPVSRLIATLIAEKLKKERKLKHKQCELPEMNKKVKKPTDQLLLIQWELNALPPAV